MNKVLYYTTSNSFSVSFNMNVIFNSICSIKISGFHIDRIDN